MSERFEVIAGRVTEPKLRGLCPDSVTFYRVDREGLLLRVGAGGSPKSWVLTYRIKGHRRSRRRTLGRFPALGLSKARDKAREWKERAEGGIDQSEVEAAAIELERRKRWAAPTVEVLAGTWFEMGCPKRKGGPSRPNTIRSYRVPMDRYVLPSIGHLVAREVERADVREMLDIAYAAGGVTGNRTLKALKRIYNWAAVEERLDVLPAWVAGPRAIEQRHEEKPSEVYLEKEELTRIWRNLDSPAVRMQFITRQVVRLMFLSAQRVTATAMARAGDIRRGVWRIPDVEGTKSGSHDVPLNTLALQVVNDTRLYLAAQKIESDWLFPSPRDSRKFITPEAIDRAVARNKDFLGNNWTPHVLRASCATWLDEMGVPTNDIALLLDHKPPGQRVTHRYMRRKGIERKKVALERWEVFLREECGIGLSASVVDIIDQAS